MNVIKNYPNQHDVELVLQIRISTWMHFDHLNSHEHSDLSEHIGLNPLARVRWLK